AGPGPVPPEGLHGGVRTHPAASLHPITPVSALMLDSLDRKFGRYAISNVTLYLIVGQVFVCLSALLGLLDLRQFVLVPALVVNGEPWRLLTFLFYPPPVNFRSMFSLAL